MIVVRLRQSTAVLLLEVRGLGGQQLGGQIPRIGVVVDALPCLAVFELCVRGEEPLVVGRAAKGFFAAGLVSVSVAVLRN